MTFDILGAINDYFLKMEVREFIKGNTYIDNLNMMLEFCLFFNYELERFMLMVFLREVIAQNRYLDVFYRHVEMQHVVSMYWKAYEFVMCEVMVNKINQSLRKSAEHFLGMLDVRFRMVGVPDEYYHVARWFEELAIKYAPMMEGALFNLINTPFMRRTVVYSEQNAYCLKTALYINNFITRQSCLVLHNPTGYVEPIHHINYGPRALRKSNNMKQDGYDIKYHYDGDEFAGKCHVVSW